MWTCVLLFVHLYEIDQLSQQTPLSPLALHQVPVCLVSKGEYTLVTLPRIVTPYHDSVDGTRDRVTYQKLVTP